MAHAATLAAMTIFPAFDAELLRRYDRPGPRYTSYPTAPQFGADFGEAAFREVIARSNQDPIPRSLSLYLHVPFCRSPCFYCGCNRIITRDTRRGAEYLERLQREIRAVAPLFDRDREVVQIHLGGGTPNFLDAGQLGELMETLETAFRFSTNERRDFSIELDPRFIDAAYVEALAFIGFNRASLGVQDFDPAVQAAVNRIQSVEQTLEIIDACRRHGLRSVNVDLIYGLPRQTLEGFGRTLDTVLAVRPDRLAVYGYAHLPELFRPQRQINPADMPSGETKLALLQLAIEKLSAAGYRYIGMDHFALPEDELAIAQAQGELQRNFMGYTTHDATDLIGLGVSAISRIGECYAQNPRDLPAWEIAVDSGRLPVWRGLLLNGDDMVREEVIQQLMCHGEIDCQRIEELFGIDFEHYFADSLEKLVPLQEDGLVLTSRQRIRATAHGRLLLRNIAMCFDAYLGTARAAPARHARAI